MLLVSIAVVMCFMEETHPMFKNGCEETDQWEECPFTEAATLQDALVSEANGPTSYGTFSSPEEDYSEVRSSTQVLGPLPDKIFTKKVIMLIGALGIFTYHSMTYDHLLPIFLQDSPSPIMQALSSPRSLFSMPSGLSLSTRSVGIILSFNGFSALVIQGLLFPYLASLLGVFPLFILCTVLHPIAYMLPPFLTFLPETMMYTGIYTCLTIRNLFTIMQYPLLLILLKESCPDSRFLGSVNGMAASIGAGARTLGPPIGGYLYDYGKSVGCVGIAWWASGVVAALGAAQLYWVKRNKKETVYVEIPQNDAIKVAEIHEVREVASDYEDSD
jgi:MFS family permease